MKSFKEFIIAVEKRMKELHPYSEITVRPMYKPTGGYTGLVIHHPDEHTVPVVNLDGIYSLYRKSGSFAECIRTIEGTLTETKPDVDAGDLTDYAYVKERLMLRVNNMNQIGAGISEMPHIRVHDLVITYSVALQLEGEKSVMMPVLNQNLKAWGISEEQLKADAFRNCPEMLPASFIRMEEMLRSTGIEPEACSPLCILTNTLQRYGAAVLFYEGVMEKVAQEVGGSYYVLPSSVHEVLILPDKDEENPAGLEELVTDVNANVVASEDQLSNKVYHYDADAHLFEMACADKEKGNLLYS